MIQAIGLTSVPRRRQPPAVDDLSFEAPPGRVTVLLGPEGAGKTSALRLLLQIQPGRGVALFRGRPFHSVPHPAREVGVLLGDVPGHPARTARGHLRMLTAVTGVPLARADEVLDVVGLTGLADQRLGTFSIGMDRRLGIAGALLGDPHTLVLDEPARGLSPRETSWLHGFVRGYAQQGGAVLVTSQNAREAALLGDRVVTVAGGRLLADQDGAEFARTRLGPRITVRTPQAQRLAAALAEHAARPDRSRQVAGPLEVFQEGGQVTVYGSSCAEVGELAFRHNILVHRLAAEPGTPGERPQADGRPRSGAVTGPSGARREGVAALPAPPGGAELEHVAAAECEPAEAREGRAVPEGAAAETGTDLPTARGRDVFRAEDEAPVGEATLVLHVPFAAARAEPVDAPAQAGEHDSGARRAPQPARDTYSSGEEGANRAAGRVPEARLVGPGGGTPERAAVTSPAVVVAQAQPQSAQVQPPSAQAQPQSAEGRAADQGRRSVLHGEADEEAGEPGNAANSRDPENRHLAQGAEDAGVTEDPEDAGVPGNAGASQHAEDTGAPEGTGEPGVAADEEATGETDEPATGTAAAEGPADAAPEPARAAASDDLTSETAPHGEEPRPRTTPEPATAPRAPSAPDSAPGTAPPSDAPAPPTDASARRPRPPQPVPQEDVRLPPRLPAVPRPGPVSPLRYELRRLCGVRTTWITACLAVAAGLGLALALARGGAAQAAPAGGPLAPPTRLLTGWLPGPLFFLSPAALAAGCLGALAFGQEFRFPALAPARSPVPRRLGLLVAKLAVSALLAAALCCVTALLNAVVVTACFGTDPLFAHHAGVGAGWHRQVGAVLALTVGCAWTGVLAAGLFRSGLAGVAVVVAVPLLGAPGVRDLLTGPAADSLGTLRGLPERLESVVRAPWPPVVDAWLAAAFRLGAQPVGRALALALIALLGAYTVTALRGRTR